MRRRTDVAKQGLRAPAAKSTVAWVETLRPSIKVIEPTDAETTASETFVSRTQTSPDVDKMRKAPETVACAVESVRTVIRSDV
jgi:hypothetical protein